MTSPSASPQRACDRLLVRGTSALDLGLRTVAATAAGVPAALCAVRADGRRAGPARMIIGGLGDRLAPPSQAEALWEHWGRPRIHWFPGNHVLHAGRRVYLREMLDFMRANDFTP